MKLKQLLTVPNLKLSWLRLSTASNVLYKEYIRPTLPSYDAALDDNIRDLRARALLQWKPRRPIRVFIPKANGLQRPITLLALEDQILLQAVANEFEKRIEPRRARLESKSIFSNICVGPKSHFFIQDWRVGYEGLTDVLDNTFDAGLRWVAHFDFSAFYDTISHDRLLKMAAPRSSYEEGWAAVRQWFEKWTDHDGLSIHHGIPQGPIASDYLAECFLIELDEIMSARPDVRYFRYVDDVRLVADSESSLRRAALQFERTCRNMGLIPNAKKHTIFEAEKKEEIRGSLPSLPTAGGGSVSLSRTKAERIFEGAIGGRPQRILDKSRARYVLFRAPKSDRLLELSLRMLDRHPEQIDALAHYLRLYQRSSKIENRLRELLLASLPYDYVRAQCWRILGRISNRKSLLALHGIAVAEFRTCQDPTLEAGLLSFLFACRKQGIGSIKQLCTRANFFSLALVASELPHSEFVHDGAATIFLRSKQCEPGLALLESLVTHSKKPGNVGVRIREINPVTQNGLAAAGLIRHRLPPAEDHINNALIHRFQVVDWPRWREVFGVEYTHATGLAIQSAASYHTNRAAWMRLQNSFNHILFLRLQDVLARRGLAGTVKTIDSRGQPVSFGTMVQPTNPFDRSYPVIAKALRNFNKRRNALPDSHPYAGGLPTTHLSGREQRTYRDALRAAYNQISIEFDPLL